MLPLHIAQRRPVFVRIMAVAVLVTVVAFCVAPTAFARNTYVITDGDTTKEYVTYESDPAQVLSAAGVELDDGDIYTTQPVDGAYAITVQRAQTVTVYNCGQKQTVTGYGETVRQLLDRTGIPTGENYTVSADLSEETYEGMELRVDHVVRVQQTYTVEIPFETTYCEDPNLPAGEEKVIVPGVVGQLQTTADVTYVNREETERTILAESLVAEPVNAIVSVGTGDGTATDAPAIGDGVIVTADGQVLTYSRTGQFMATAYTHTDAGCDFTTATGTTVRIGTVAVDPRVIPYGTRMFIVCNDGSYIYGIGTAEDCGSSIKNNRVDLYFPTNGECVQFGVRWCTVYFLD